MKTKIKIGEKKPHPLYIPVNLAENEGFIGETDMYANARTITVVHPDAKLEEVKESLEIVLKDIELRLKSRNLSTQIKDE